MNFQQRYLRLSKEIKNIKEAQSKVVLDLRSVVYTSTQTMQYDHYWGRFTYLSVYLEDENGFDVRDNMCQFYFNCSSPNTYLSTFSSQSICTVWGRRPPAWQTTTWTVTIKAITSKRVARMRIYNSYTGETTYVTEGEIIG